MKVWGHKICFLHGNDNLRGPEGTQWHNVSSIMFLTGCKAKKFDKLSKSLSPPSLKNVEQKNNYE